MPNLAKRVITGGILAGAIVAATLSLPTPWFALLIGLFVIVGAWEWAGLAGWPAPASRLACSAAVAVLLLGASWLLERPGGALALLLGGLMWWLVALAWVVRIQQGLSVEALHSPLVRFAAGCLILVPTWGAAVHLHGGAESGAPLVVYILLVVSTADTAAYFVGRRFGRRRLASNISPGKSVEGVLGALAAVAVLAIAVGLLADVGAPLGFVVLSVITGAVSILGDLTESVFKRRAGVKDSGTIIPGHGGILDRIDSVTAAAPIFVLGCFLQGSVS